MVILWRRRQQRRRAGRADLLIRVQQHLPAHAIGRREPLERLQRGEHDGQPALGVGDAGSAEFAGLDFGDGLEWIVGRIDGVQVNVQD